MHELIVLHEGHDVRRLEVRKAYRELRELPVWRRMCIEVRASSSNARYPCFEKSEGETPCTGHIAIICAGIKAVIVEVRRSSNVTYK